MNITEANAVSKLIGVLAGTRYCTSSRDAVQDVAFLAERINKALHTGPAPDELREAAYTLYDLSLEVER